MAATLQKIPPVHPEKIPPRGAVAHGITPDGKQLFKLTRRRARGVPMIDSDGQRVWRRHALTGEPQYPRFAPEVYTEELLFTLESPGNGTIEMQPYLPPSAEELAADARRAEIAAMRDGLAEAMVDAGLSPTELLNLIKQRGTAAVVEAESNESEAAFPKHKGGGWWYLSDGSTFQGKKEEAVAAEANLNEEAQAEAERTAREAMGLEPDSDIASDAPGIEGY